MKTLLCFTAFIFLLTSFSIENENTQQNSSKEILTLNKFVYFRGTYLKEFKNKTGPTFGQTQLNSLIGFINNASTIYSNDIAKNLRYIKDHMDAAFSGSDNQYNIILQNVENKDYGDAAIYCEGGTNYAFLGTGVNLKFPNWTYLVYKLYAINDGYSYIPNAEDRGSGMSADDGERVKLVIQSVQGFQTCKCSEAKQVKNILQSYLLRRRWNVICQSTPNIHSYNAIKKQEWIMFKPYSCVYFVFSV